MSAFHALDAARAAGVDVQLDGKFLAITATGEPPADIIDMLRRYKYSIMAALQRPLVPRQPLQPVQPWDATDWQAYFDERVVIAEFDGKLAKPQAEALALVFCVGEWLSQDPLYSPADRCVWCGDAERVNGSLVPVGIVDAGEAWLHRACIPAWHSARKAEGVAALAAIGISSSKGGTP